jgi:hypothetical protein
MITSISDFLQRLAKKEAEILDGQEITHAPTIGAMYEGLTRDILSRSIPESLNLQVVSGFIEDPRGGLSPQLDAMLVKGEGRLVPFTSVYVWRIQEVLAVFEVKKNLYGADLEDAYEKLRTVGEIHKAYINEGNNIEDAGPSIRAFANLTGLFPRNSKEIRALPIPLLQIFDTLALEQVGPVRIVFGYNGYVSEASLRNGLVTFIEERIAQGNQNGLGPGSLPNLIVCRNNSLLKVNGHPYCSPASGDWWNVLVSNSENPILLLVELIWTRLANEFRAEFPVDDTLKLERFTSLLQVKYCQTSEQNGWAYRTTKLENLDRATEDARQWTPTSSSILESVVISLAAKHGSLDTQDPEFRKWAHDRNCDPDELIQHLVDKRLLARSTGTIVRPINDTTLIVLTPDGKTHMTENAKLASLWMNDQLQKKNQQR